MNLIGSCNTGPIYVHYKAEERGRIFIAMKIHEAEIQSHETTEKHFRLVCCIDHSVFPLKGLCKAISLHLRRAEKSKNNPLKLMAHTCC